MQTFICIFTVMRRLFFLFRKKALKNQLKTWDFSQQLFSLCTFLSQHRKSIIPAAISANASITSISLVDRKHRHIRAAPKSNTAAPDLFLFLCLMPLHHL